MATKAELQAILDMDNKPFIRAMGKAVATAKKGSNDIKKPFAGLGAALGRFFVPVAIGASLKALGSGALSAAGSIQDSSDAIGISTDKFQQYVFAIEQAGGGQDDFTKGMGLMIGLLDDAKDSSSDAAKKLGEFGITAADSPEEAILKLSDYLKEAEGSTAAIAKVMDLLGAKLSRKLIPALRVGREEFQKNGEAASKMEAENIAALDTIGDKLDQYKRRAMNAMGNALGGVANAVMGAGEPTVMDEVVVEANANKPRRPGFWQTDRPTMIKKTGSEEMFGPPFAAGRSGWSGGNFAGFGNGYFPTDGSLGNSGGLTSGSLSSTGLGGMGSAYGKVRSGDAARAKAAASEAKKTQKVADPNTAKLVTLFGGTPESAQ